MNTNPDAKRILCFGDSNTKGQKPYDVDLGYWERHSANVRWTGILQDILGDHFEILEEGLGGRTLDKQHPQLDFSTNGFDAWKVALNAHKPIDLAIWMLGVNDTQDCFDFDPVQLKTTIEKYIKRFFEKYPDSSLLALNFPELKSTDFHTQQSVERSRSIRKLIEETCLSRESNNIYYCDMDKCVTYSTQDELHLDEENHKILGEVIADKVKEIVG